MSKTKKMTFNMLAVGLKDDELVSVVINEEDGTELLVKPRLGFSDSVRFVRDIADSSFDEESGDYLPEVFELVTWINILVIYAGVSAPTNIEKAHRVIYGTDICSRIMSVIDRRQLEMLIESAKERVEFRREAMIASNAQKLDDLIARMDRVMTDGEAAIEEFGSDEFQQKLNRLAEVASTEIPEASVDSVPGNIIPLDRVDG